MATLREVIPKMDIKDSFVVYGKNDFPNDVCVCIMPNVVVVSAVVCESAKKEIVETGDCSFILDLKVHALLNGGDYRDLKYVNGEFLLTITEFSSN